MNIILRREALALGHRHYFTGVPCARGHIEQRHASNGWCKGCARIDVRERRAAKPVETLALRRKNDAARRAKDPHAFLAARAINQRNRKARLKGSDEKFSKHDIFDIFKLQGGLVLGVNGKPLSASNRRPCRCAACGINVEWGCHQIDHIVPLSMDGRNSRRNLQIFCKVNRCNQKKRSRDPIDFMREEFGLLL